jgi:hypothetical protein
VQVACIQKWEIPIKYWSETCEMYWKVALGGVQTAEDRTGGLLKRDPV